MEILDLRNVAKLFIKTLENKAASFAFTGKPGAPSMTGATASLIISKDTVIATLTLGAGLSIIATDKMAVSLPALQAGMYNYIFEIFHADGKVTRIIDQIHCF